MDPTLVYNITQLQNTTNPVQLITVINSFSDNIFVPGFLIAFYIILILILKRYDFGEELLAASFACMVLSFFLRSLGWVNLLIVIFFVTVTAFAGLVSFFRQS